jgi:hypothetical protein
MISKKDFAVLVDAYADAKTTKNAFLISTIGRQIEEVMDEIFPENVVKND